MDCPNLAACPFLKKHGNTKDLMCKGFILLFCKGVKQNECKRKIYKQEHGAPPSEDMMPNGLLINVKKEAA